MGYLLPPSVEAELDAIWLYVAKDSGSVEVADRLIEFIEAHFHTLAQYPYMGRRRHYDLGNETRSFPAGGYVIFYRPEEGDIRILHVVHGSRDLPALFEE